MSEIEYSDLLFEISEKIDVNLVRRLVFMCRKEITKGNASNIHDVLALFEELERHNRLGIDRLDTLKEMLTQLKKRSLLKKVEDFENKRKAHSVGIISSLKQAAACLKGVVKLVCNVRTITGGLLLVSSVMALYGCTSLTELRAVITEVILPLYCKVTEISEGSLCITVQAETPAALRELWDIYKDGTLQSRLQEFLVTEEIKELAGGEDIEVTVYIDEQEYKEAYFDLLLQNEVPHSREQLEGRHRRYSDSFLCFKPDKDELELMTLKQKVNKWKLEKQTIEEGHLKPNAETSEETGTLREAVTFGQKKQHIRSDSESTVCLSPVEELPMLTLTRLESEFKYYKEKITVIEKAIEKLSLGILGTTIAEEKEGRTEQTLEEWKVHNYGQMDNGSDPLEMSQQPKAELIGMEKFVFIQKYLEDVQRQDTCSVGAEEGDSGLGAHAAASELGTIDLCETNSLFLKDLNEDVILALTERLKADEAVLETFCSFFGLKTHYLFTMNDISKLFPATTVGVLKECFEVLQLYDLLDLLEKGKPRSLLPALSPKQIEKLRDDRPTKYHSNIAILVVNDCAERDNAEKIETFFKNLNSQNEITVIASTFSEETRNVLKKMKEMKQSEQRLKEDEMRIRHQLEIELSRQKEPLEEAVQKDIEGKPISEEERVRNASSLMKIEREELTMREQLHELMEKLAMLKEQMEMETDQMKKFEKENEKATTILSTDMSKLIDNQEKFTFITVFVITDGTSFYDHTALRECVVEKLALIPDHAKLVVSSSPEWKNIREVSETLHVISRLFGDECLTVFNLMTEIFNKRWQKLDLISMMQELNRTRSCRLINIKDSLSFLPRFKRTEEQSSV